MSYRRRLLSTSLALGVAALLGACDTAGPGTLTDPVVSETPQPDFGLVVGGGSCGDGCAEAIIGRIGGLLRLGESYLWVPPFAVRTPTLFRIQLIESGEYGLGADLTAIRHGVELEWFNRPVYLALHLGDLQDGTAQQFFLADEYGERVAGSRVDPGPNLVTGWLWHFSQYVIASN